MASWEDLSAKYSAGEPTSNPNSGWSELSKRYIQQTGSVDSLRPDNTAAGMARQRIVQDMSLPQKAAAAFGAGLTDVGMGIKQILGKATPAEVDEKRKLDEALTDGPLGTVSKVAGSIAPSLAVPTGPLSSLVGKVAPKLAPIVESSAQGAIGNAIQPVGTGESRGFNAAVGAALGAVPTAARVATRGAVGSISPEAAQLAQTALSKYNIPLQASDVTDSRFLKSLNSMFGDLPITGGIANKAKDAKQVAFNRAVGNTFGVSADRLDAKAAQDAYSAMQKTFGDVYSRNPADVFKVDSQLQPVLSRVSREGTADEQRIVQSRLQDLYSKIDPNTGTIDGEAFNRWQSELRKRAGDNDLLNDFRGAALRGYNDSVSGADAALLNQTRQQYKNFKTVEPLLEKAATGDISPGLLQGRVANQFSDYSRGGGGDLGELARIGNRFMVDRTPQTGGSGRALLQNSLILSGVTLPVAAPLNLALNNSVTRDAILNKALGTGLLNTSPAVDFIGKLGSGVATQALPAYGLQSGLLSF